MGNNSFKFPIGKQINVALAQEIEKQSVYISEDLERLQVSKDLASVLISLKTGADVAALEAKLERFLRYMIRGHKNIEPTVHHMRSRNATIYQIDVFEELKRRKWLYEHSTGIVSLSGPALKLYRLIDATLSQQYARRFDAEERPFPAMVNSALLARCGYFEMHPNAVSFVSHLVNDFDVIEDFRLANKDKLDGLYLTQTRAFAKPQQCLNPAACFPCYEALQGTVVANSGTALTWVGRVFRYESTNTVGLDRLWEFNVRELVFVGNDDYVQQSRLQVVAMIKDLLEDWDLEGQIETATDPFFATVYAAKAFWQKSMDVKYELHLPIFHGANGRRGALAVGSVNMHGTFFGNRFSIKDASGNAAHTACVGFGLERWVLALFTQYGFTEANWPGQLRGIFDK